MRGTTDVRGRDATRPTDIPASGWKDIAARVKEQARSDNVSLLGAGIAFFAVLSLAPALAALVSIYGLVASPADVARHVEDLTSAMPTEARDLLVNQLDAVVRASPRGLSIGAVVGIALALWTASAAMKHLIVAVSVAYGEKDDRGPLQLRVLALVLTIAAVVFTGLVMLVLTALPGMAEDLFGNAGRTIVAWGRWPILVVLMLAALAILYRVGPDRDGPRWRWVTGGAVVATALWLLGCLAFSFYASQFGSYNETYGAMASVVVLMLWFYITALCVILGAEINAEMEHQTARDTTVGEARPMGRRGAEMADTIGAAKR